MTMRSLIAILFSAILLTVTGCAGLVAPSADPATAEASAQTDRADESAKAGAAREERATEKDVRDFLTSDMVYEALAGELSLQRKQLEVAYSHLYRAAELARDAQAAERAMKVAMMAQDQAAAQAAGELWLEIEPDNLQALQLATVLAMRGDDDARVQDYLAAIIVKGDAEERDGFIDAMSATLQDKDHDKAAQAMGRLAESYPRRAEGPYTLALMASMREDYASAEEQVRRALEIAPGMPRAVGLLARIRIARDDKEGALEILRQGVEDAPEEAMLRASLARILVEEERIEEAYQQYQALVELNPDDHDSRFVLGVLALQLERRDEARQWFEQLYQQGVKRNQAAFYLGWLAEEADEVERAMEWYTRVEQGETHGDARMRAARLIADQDLEAAREILQRLRGGAASRDEELRIIQVEASLLAEHADNDAVYDFYARALETYPGESELLYARAMFAVSVDNIAMLEEDLRRILEQDPDHADALNALGYTLADRTERFDEAYQYIKRAHELNPESPAILDSMGWVLYRLGNLEESLEYLRQAYELSEDAEIASHYGEVLWFSGDKAMAREVWEKAREAEPESDYLRKTLERIDP